MSGTLFDGDPSSGQPAAPRAKPKRGGSSDVEPGVELLAGLNPAQHRAVTHQGRPVVVLAGPGTGKTRVIIHRIAYGLRELGVTPERVVALTYTVKAANELRERLAGLAGAGPAERVNVHTFHGFGLRLLRRFGDSLGLPADPLLIDSAQRRRLLRELILAHHLLRAERGRGVEALLPEVERALGAMADQAVEPDRGRRFAAQWAQTLDENANGLDALGLEAERARLARFEDHVRLAELFASECAQRGWLTYADLIRLPTRILREQRSAAALIRDDYRHLVVDEFQDVNAAQIELLRLLAPPATTGPDLCVVGDDDQAIYEFRGADDRAFAKFAAAWPGHETIALTENFRSERPILAAANAVIDAPGHERFAPDKLNQRPAHLAGVPDRPGAGVTVVKLAKDQEMHDGEAIAMLILTQRHAEPARRWRDFAVLARSMGDLDRVGAALELEGIPAARRRRGGLSSDPGVEVVFKYIDLLVDPQAHWAARAILMRGPNRPEPGRLIEWERAYAAQRSRHGADAEAETDPGAYVPWLAARVGSGQEPSVQALAARLTELAALAATKRAEEVVRHIMAVGDVAHVDLLDARERAARVAKLAAVLRFVRERQPRLDAPGDVAALRRYMDDLTELDREIEGGVAIDGEPAAQAEDEDGDPTADAVQLITAHSAKGLEFDTVFVTRVGQHGFPKAMVDEPALPPGLADRVGDERSLKARKHAEERRLFYVACTRAKRKLVLLGKWNKNRSDGVNYLDELVRDRPVGEVADAITFEDVARLASERGVGAAGRGEIERAAAGLERLAARREALLRARRDARLEAAAALDAADRPGLSIAELAQIGERLRAAAGRVAVAAAVEREGAAPGWSKASDAPAVWPALANELERLTQPSATPAPASTSLWPGLKPPLRLSYSTVSQYQSCPRCFYLRNVLHIPDPQSDVAQFGSAAHKALERFYRQFAAADAEGRTKPGRARLLELGKEEFFRAMGAQQVKPDDLVRLSTQLEMTFDRLHDPDGHVLELEKLIEWPYVRAGVEHRLLARIDRIDQRPDGGVRIIDYKTGYPTKSKTQPDADDLQLGLYALAAQALLSSNEIPAGTAEYWVLATGQRGVLDLSKLKIDKVRAAIDAVIDGLLAGRFEKGKKCTGLCEIVGPE